MRAYIIRRLLIVIPTVFIITVIIFLLMRLIPGDIVDDMIFRMEQAGEIFEGDQERLRAHYGLNTPAPLAFGRFLGVAPQADGEFKGVLQGDLGESWVQRRDVRRMIGEKLPVTLELGLLAFLLAQLIALPIGILSAIRQNTMVDYVGRSFAIIFISAPSFWIATLVIVFGGLWFRYLPPVNFTPFFDNPGKNLAGMWVPAVTTALLMGGGMMRWVRTMMLEVMRQDYIRTAWSKGLKEFLVVGRHALKNTMIPVVTVMGLQIPILIGGSVVIEQIFNLPGMGFMTVQALTTRDYPLVSGLMLVLSFGIVIINLVTDILYGFLDPKVQYR
jgi:peptide/nickel transport system permease protein